MKSAKRFTIIQESIEGKLSVTEASILLGLSERQIIRLRKGVLEKRKDATKHGNTGKSPSNKISDQQEQSIVQLYKDKYYSSNFQHFIELLAENEKITISDNTARRILNAANIKSPRTKRKPKKHIRRKRHEHEGSLVQADATPHDFFNTGNDVCLHGVVDDATGKILGLYMTINECLEGYFSVFEQMIVDHGIPASIYADRHTIFASPKLDKLTIEEELAGKQVNDTQLGRAMRELGIVLIFARSAQAKGRIERLWGTLQDRLTIELRINGIKDIESANQFLPSFIEKYNRRFAVEALETQSMFMPNTFDLISILCVRKRRKLDIGGAFSFYGQLFVIIADIPSYTYIEVIAHHKHGIYAMYRGNRYDVKRINKPKHKKTAKPLSAGKKPYIPPDSHCFKYGKEKYIQYSNEYNDLEILAILDEIFSTSLKL